MMRPMSEETPTTPRTGSPADLVRRMERMEVRHEELSREVGSLAATVGRVESNLEHASELNRLRFDSLDATTKNIGSQLELFVKRIEAILTGEVETMQARQGRELVLDYQRWRETVETRLDKGAENDTRLNTYGRVLQALTIGGGASIIIGLAALWKG